MGIMEQKMDEQIEGSKLLENQFNEWLLEPNETVIAWASLPQPPCL